MVWDKYDLNDEADAEFGLENKQIDEDGRTIETEKAKRISEFKQKQKLLDLEKKAYAQELNEEVKKGCCQFLK